MGEPVVYQTKSDLWVLSVIGIPIFPILILMVSSATNGALDEALAGAAIASVYVPYLTLWLLSRFRSERRFLFWPDRVHIPAFFHHITGREYRYDEIHCLVRGDENLTIIFNSGRKRMIDDNAARHSEIEKMFARFGVRTET